MATCFVVMGYRTKSDPDTGKEYDLDKSYRQLIKPAAEAAGFSVVRSDEVIRPGRIERQMYYWLFHADLVIADLTTLNANAMYELGVRMAFRPKATIVIAADDTKIPFNLSQERFFTYSHHGKALDADEVDRFRPLLADVCREARRANEPDSLIYTLLGEELIPPSWQGGPPPGGPHDTIPARESLAGIMARTDELKAQGDWTSVVELLREQPDNDPWISQQLALALYKRNERDGQPAPVADLLEARTVLSDRLDPAGSTDPETLGIWGAIHKRLAEHPDRSHDERMQDLEHAITSYRRGFVLRDDHYNGVNYAYLLRLRAKEFSPDPREAEVDQFRAVEAWSRVRDLTKDVLDADPADGSPELFWRGASLLESLHGLQDPSEGLIRQKLEALPHQDWMMDSARGQLEKLDVLLGRGGTESPMMM
ncbi:MAG: DUF4071 domain-containing protein [Rhodothermales bacterium]|nr:DUF4071 domain-containing protein [Rhodothermales bacterium]MBO6781051.1 DUF4071 domain-containing protein [Rhodothermales bacterium]